MKTKSWVGLAFAAILALLLSAPSWAQDEPAEGSATADMEKMETEKPQEPMAAKLLRLDGMAEVKGPGDTGFRSVSGGDMLPMSGTFRVLPGGKAQIELPNGGIVLAKEFTVIRLDQLATDKNSEISIPLGEFLIGFKTKLPEKQMFKVNTPAAVAGIRGTLFWGLADADLSSTFACFHDTITLTGGGEEIELAPGYVSSTQHGQSPAVPAKHSVPASYLETFAVEGSLEGLPDILK